LRIFIDKILKIARTIADLEGKEELEDIAKQETTELVCAFCKEKYHFSQKEITDLLDNLN